MTPHRPRLWTALRAWPLAIALGLLLLHYAVGATFLGGYILDLGSLMFPTLRYAYFALFWIVLGTGMALSLAWGGFRLVGHPQILAKAGTPAGPGHDRGFVALGALLGFLVPCLLRVFVLQGMPLTDDESSYRFAAELIGSGRIRAVSPPLKLFFDNIFMINDGHFYSCYFLGWPAMLAPGVLLKAAGFMNAVYSGLTVIPLFSILRRLAGSRPAQLGIMLYVTSPLLMIGSATGLSHTSCMLMLTVLVWLFLRAGDEDSPLLAHLGMGLTFGAAFFIRPLTTVAVAGPFLIAWFFRTVLRPGPARGKKALALALPLIVFAALFLLANKAQNGDAFKPGYQRYLEYSRENQFRFSLWQGEPSTSLVGISPGLEPLAKLGVGFLRISLDLFGWPLLFVLLLPFAWKLRHGPVIAWSFLAMVGTSFFIQDAGIDTFGPVHLYEAGLPAILFVILGAKSLAGLIEARVALANENPGRAWHRKYIPYILIISLMVSSLMGFTPFRIAAVRTIAENVRTPFQALKDANIHNAVIFAPRPFIRQDPIAPTRHFVFFRPNNDPDLKNDIIWVNTLSSGENQELMRHFPGRRGYIMIWERDYRVTFTPLERILPGRDAARRP